MATIKSTLKFQDEMSSRMESIARKLEMTAAEAEIAKANLDQLENTQRQWKTTLDSLKNAQIQDKDAIANAREEYLKALRAYDDGVLKVSKYERELKNLEQQQKQNIKGFESLAGKIVTLSAAFQLFNQIKGIITGINAKINEYVQYTRVQVQAENQLAVITKNRLGLTDEEVRSLYELAAAQQKIGVVGDEATITAMAGLAAFTKQKSSIEALTPAMNNLAVKMYGYNVTAESMDMISKSLGKALLGDVGALSRMGVKIDDVTKKRLLSLKEEERAIELAKIIHSVTGNMNEDMAKDVFGKMQQSTNALGDSYERLGNILVPLQASFMSFWSGLVNFGVNALQKTIDVIGFLTPALLSMATVILIANIPAIIALGKQFLIAGGQALIAGTKMAAAWLIGLGPIGWITLAVGGLMLALTALIQKNAKVAESFWKIVNAVDTALTKFAQWRNRDDEQKVAELQAGLDRRIANRSQRVENIKTGKTARNGRPLIGSINTGGVDNSLITSTSGGKALKTQNQGDISLKDDDIALLHDIATRDYAQYFQQLTPNLTIPSMVIHETADVNQVIGAIANAVTGTVSSSTSGGYATA